MQAHGWRWMVAVFAVVGAVAFGCGSGGPQPVKGHLIWKDTKQPAVEIVGSIISFEQAASESSARGQVQADGSFQLTTLNENDGAALGDHKVLIIEVGRQSTGGEGGSRLEPGKISIKYASPNSSDLTVTIKPGLNEPKLEIERFQP